MTIREYLHEHLTKGDNIPGTQIETYHRGNPKKGTVTVEYNPEDDSADITHVSKDTGVLFYQALNAKELKDTIEYCLGHHITDKQWEFRKTETVTDFEELEELDF